MTNFLIKKTCIQRHDVKITNSNGLRVNGGEGVWYREFTKSLTFRYLDDVLKQTFRYVHLFL